jgi:malate permease and related proteins
MYADIFAIIAPIFISALIGYIWARSGVPFSNEFISRFVMNIGAPCLIIGTLGAIEMPGQKFIDILIATLCTLLINAVAAILLCRLLKISTRAFFNPLCFTNNGNMGLPLCLFAFGDEGLAIALGIFLVMSLVHFSLGIAIVSGRSNWRKLLLTPIIYAGIAAIILIFTGWKLPSWLQNTFSLLGSPSIPLMLLTLGVSLAQLRIKSISKSMALGFARLLIGFCAGVLVAELLSLQGNLRGVVIIQASMPAAVFNYLLALRYQQQPEAVAGMVISSTLISFICLPLLLWYVL